MAAASDRAYELLKQRLIGGSYAPGAQLKEEHLARELDISRTPVRAALKRLIDDGLATSDAGRGVRAAQWTDGDIRETYQLRSLLEGHAAELAAQRGGKALAENLHQLNQRMESAIARDRPDMAREVQDLNSLFHRALLDASGSARLRGLLASIIDMPVIVRSFFISTRADMQQSLQHHRDLAAAVDAGDGELARQAMQLHLRVAAHRFLQRRREFVARHPAAAGNGDVSPPPGTRRAARRNAQDDC